MCFVIERSCSFKGCALCHTVRPYSTSAQRFQNSYPDLGSITRSSDSAKADWFHAEVFSKRLCSWIAGGELFHSLITRYSTTALQVLKVPEDLILSEEMAYALSHGQSAFRGTHFLLTMKIEQDTSVDAIADVVSLEKAARNTRGNQGILETTGRALADMDIVFHRIRYVHMASRLL